MATLPSNPTKTATEEYLYKFSHWSITENGSAVDVSSYQIKGNVIFYAVYKEIENNIVTLNIDGVARGCRLQVGENLNSELAGSVLDINDNNSIGWYLDSEFKNPVIDEMIVVDGITLYTRMATLDKITINNGVVSAKSTSISGEVVIPACVTSIEEWAFYYCANITSVIIPTGVTSIGARSFYYCTSLTSINLPSGITRIENYVFAGCSNLKSVSIPNSVISIGNNTFISCTSLTSITIPSSVKSIEEWVFTGCASLTSVIFEDPNGWYVTQIENETSGIDLLPSDLSDSCIAKNYLTGTYRDYYWYKHT